MSRSDASAPRAARSAPTPTSVAAGVYSAVRSHANLYAMRVPQDSVERVGPKLLANRDFPSSRPV